jgi:hypothetical protein
MANRKFRKRDRGGATMILPGDTEAGSAGKQPCRGIVRRAHRDDERSQRASLLRFSKEPHRSRWIAFDNAKLGNYDIYVISADGGPPHRLTSGPFNNVRPSWSRDGRWIYFGSNPTGTS